MTAVKTLTPRARKTRAQLLTAAEAVFAEKGFLDARVADIAERASVAHGTFYTYFDTKDDVFHEVAELLVERIYAKSASDPSDPDDARTRIELANRRYLHAIRDDAQVFAILEQVAGFSPEMRELRRRLRHRFVDRAAHGIARLQREGRADPTVDPHYAASALGGMVEQFAYVWHVLGEPFDEDEAVATLTALWAHAIRLNEE